MDIFYFISFVLKISVTRISYEFSCVFPSLVKFKYKISHLSPMHKDVTVGGDINTLDYYYLTVKIGTPGQTFNVLMDTG